MFDTANKITVFTNLYKEFINSTDYKPLKNINFTDFLQDYNNTVQAKGDVAAAFNKLYSDMFRKLYGELLEEIYSGRYKFLQMTKFLPHFDAMMKQVYDIAVEEDYGKPYERFPFRFGGLNIGDRQNRLGDVIKEKGLPTNLYPSLSSKDVYLKILRKQDKYHLQNMMEELEESQGSNFQEAVDKIKSGKGSPKDFEYLTDFATKLAVLREHYHSRFLFSRWLAFGERKAIDDAKAILNDIRQKVAPAVPIDQYIIDLADTPSKFTEGVRLESFAEMTRNDFKHPQSYEVCKQSSLERLNPLELQRKNEHIPENLIENAPQNLNNAPQKPNVAPQEVINAPKKSRYVEAAENLLKELRKRPEPAEMTDERQQIIPVIDNEANAPGGKSPKIDVVIVPEADQYPELDNAPEADQYEGGIVYEEDQGQGLYDAPEADQEVGMDGYDDVPIQAPATEEPSTNL